VSRSGGCIISNCHNNLRAIFFCYYQEEVVDSSLEFLILASDGLWDVVTNDEAVAMVKPIQDPQEAADKLLREASKRGSSDNITVVIVRFLDGTTSGDKSGEEKESAHDQTS